MAAIEGNPLAGLQEIPLPQAVSYMPATTGWVVVGVLLLALLIYLAWRAVKYWRANAYRREALAELAHVERRMRTAPGWESLEALPTLIKRTAIAATSRERVAALTGREWLRFLDRTLGGDSFSRGTGQLLTRIAYHDEEQFSVIPAPDVHELLRLTRRWIRRHDVADL